MHFFSSSSNKVARSFESWSKSVRGFRLSLKVISFSPELVSRSKENVGERSGPISKLMLENSTSEIDLFQIPKFNKITDCYLD